MRLSNARLSDGRTVSVSIEANRITEVTPAPAEGQDLEGRLLLPGLIDGHVHLDKTLLGLPWRPHEAGDSVRDRIETERRLRPTLGRSVQQRATALLERMASFGTVALRTHVDIDDSVGLVNLEAVLEVVEAFRGRMEIQVVAFPQSGIVTRPGVPALLDEALRMGVQVMGGLDPTTIDGDPAAHLDVVFGLAARHGAGVDIHLHEQGALGNATLRDIAARTGAAGMAGQVVVSHAFSLGTPDGEDFAATADALAGAGVAILTAAPGAAPMPPVLPLRARGVVVFAGSDNIRDLWSPFGTGDMLQRAFLVAQRQGFRTDADIAVAFDLCTGAAAQALGLAPRRVMAGAPADLVAVRAETLAEAVALCPDGRLVWQAGRPLGSSGSAGGSAGAPRSP